MSPRADRDQRSARQAAPTPSVDGPIERLLSRPLLSIVASASLSLLVTVGLSYLLGGGPPGRVGLTIALVAGAGIAALLGDQHRRSRAKLEAAYRMTAAQLAEVERLRAALEASAARDALTGLLNRRGLDDAFARLHAQDAGLVLVVIDLDGFKSVNDRFGHLAGDRVLAEVARALAASVRSGDAVARFGGDEFVLLLGAGDAAALDEVVERASAAVSEALATYGVGSDGLGCSTGVARAPDDGVTLDALLGVADDRMYARKRRGATSADDAPDAAA